MSAPKEAQPVGSEGWQDQQGRTISDKEFERHPDFKIKCSCGFRGHAGQLLGVDDEETLWCPRCKGSGWEFV